MASLSGYETLDGLRGAFAKGNMTLPRIGNLRAYIASTGATGALIAGAMVAFLATGALVAFDGSPLGGDGAGGSVSITDQVDAAPARAAAALSDATDGVRQHPAGGSVLASAIPGGAASGGGPAAGAKTASGGGTADPLSSGGSLTDAVNDATGGNGIPPLTDSGGVTDSVDDAVKGVTDGVGGLLGGGGQSTGGQGGLGGGLGQGVGGLLDRTTGLLDG